MNGLIKHISVMMILTIMAPGVSGAKKPKPFRVQKLNVRGLGRLLSVDIDGDGFKDFIFNEGHKFYYFMQENESFTQSPTDSLEAPLEAVYWDITDKLGEGVSLFTIAPDGVYRQSFTGGRRGEPEKIIDRLSIVTLKTESQKADSLFEGEVKEKKDVVITIGAGAPEEKEEEDDDDFQRVSFLYDFNDDNHSDVILPVDESSYAIYLTLGDSFLSSQEVTAPQKRSYSFKNRFQQNGGNNEEKASLQSELLTATLPLTVSDCNGDSLLDLIFAYKEWNSCYPQETDGRFAVEAVKMSNIDMKKQRIVDEFIEALEEKYKSERNLELNDPLIHDLNNDGHKDLVVTKMSGGFMSFVSQSMIYYSKPDETFPDTPDNIFVFEGISGFDNDQIVDFNNDGYMDLNFISLQFSITGLIKLLITKRMTFDMHFYINSPDGFPDEPTQTRSITFKLDFDEENELGMYFEGDFNGDGLYDFLQARGTEESEIFYGREGEVFSNKKDVKFKIDMNNEPHLEDLNGDSLTDIFVISEDKTKNLRELLVLFAVPEVLRAKK